MPNMLRPSTQQLSSGPTDDVSHALPSSCVVCEGWICPSSTNMRRSTNTRSFGGL